MKALSLTTMSLAVLGLSLVAGSNVATAANPKPAASNQYECFTDDGYGRKRPCSAGYMQKRATETATSASPTTATAASFPARSASSAEPDMPARPSPTAQASSRQGQS